MIVDLIDVTHLTSKEITLLAEIQAECYPDPTEIENEREQPQAIAFPRQIRTVLAQRCLDADQAKMKAKWDRTRYHGTHEKRKWVSKRVKRTSEGYNGDRL